MSKFKVGDRVRVIKTRSMGGNLSWDAKLGEVVTINEDSTCPFVLPLLDGKHRRCAGEECFELIKSGDKKVTEPKKHLYQLKKDTLEYKAGVVVKEQCTDGTQDFNVLDAQGDETGKSIDRELVVDNAEWFQEVKVQYVPVVKRGRKPGVKKAKTSSSYWTPERRKAQSDRMKKLRKQRKNSWGTR